MQPSYAPGPVGRRSARAGALFSAVLRRRGGRRAISVVSMVLGIAGVAMFAYPVATDALAGQRQGQLRQHFGDAQYVEAYRLHEIKVGQGLTRLQMPAIGVDVLVVEGTSTAALKAGAGHYPETQLPGQAGNVAIAGHRTTYGRPFNRLDQMKPGDIALLQTPFAIYTYTVVPPFDGHANPWPVDPSDVRVVAAPSDPNAHWLTLTTCNPKGSARQRLILRLTLTKTQYLTKDGKPVDIPAAPPGAPGQHQPATTPGVLPGSEG